MSGHNAGRKNVARSYRLDGETIALIDRLTLALRDPETGQERSATDVVRLAVRDLARRKLRPERSE